MADGELSFFVPDGSKYGGLRLLDRGSPELTEFERAAQTLGRPQPQPDRPACPKHPEWQPTRRGPQPRPSATMCPFCRDEALPQAPTEYVTREVVGVVNAPDPRLDLYYDRHEQRADGIAVPGSLEEAEALAAIDRARDEDEDGLMRGHPDVPGLTFRRGVSDRVRDQRRSAAERYWRKTATR